MKKAEKKTRKKSSSEAINAEFKHLRKRIQKLEAIVYDSKVDNGLVGETDDVITKG